VDFLFCAHKSPTDSVARGRPCPAHATPLTIGGVPRKNSWPGWLTRPGGGAPPEPPGGGPGGGPRGGGGGGGRGGVGLGVRRGGGGGGVWGGGPRGGPPHFPNVKLSSGLFFSHKFRAGPPPPPRGPTSAMYGHFGTQAPKRSGSDRRGTCPRAKRALASPPLGLHLPTFAFAIAGHGYGSPRSGPGRPAGGDQIERSPGTLPRGREQAQPGGPGAPGASLLATMALAGPGLGLLAPFGPLPPRSLRERTHGTGACPPSLSTYPWPVGQASQRGNIP
jgi:hypothetical protein